MWFTMAWDIFWCPQTKPDPIIQFYKLPKIKFNLWKTRFLFFLIGFRVRLAHSSVWEWFPPAAWLLGWLMTGVECASRREQRRMRGAEEHQPMGGHCGEYKYSWSPAGTALGATRTTDAVRGGVNVLNTSALIHLWLIWALLDLFTAENGEVWKLLLTLI